MTQDRLAANTEETLNSDKKWRLFSYRFERVLLKPWSQLRYNYE